METLENAVFLSLKQKALTLQLYKDLRFGKVTFLSNSLVITLKTALFSKGFWWFEDSSGWWIEFSLSDGTFAREQWTRSLFSISCRWSYIIKQNCCLSKSSFTTPQFKKVIFCRAPLRMPHSSIVAWFSFIQLKADFGTNWCWFHNSLLLHHSWPITSIRIGIKKIKKNFCYTVYSRSWLSKFEFAKFNQTLPRYHLPPSQLSHQPPA